MRPSRILLFALLFGPLILSGPGLLTKAAQDAGPGQVSSNDRGLHGYISFDAELPPNRSEFSAGMGFYSAVWPLIGEPITDFQIGLPSAWIIPDNSDNKDTPKRKLLSIFIGILIIFFASDLRKIKRDADGFAFLVKNCLSPEQ